MDSRFSMLVGLNRNERESPRLQCHVSARHPPAPPLNKSRPDRWVCGQSGHSLETQFDVQNSRLPAANGRGSGPNINNVRSCKSIGVLIVSGRRLSRLDDIPRLAHMEACRLGIAIDILLACCRCRSDQEKPARSLRSEAASLLFPLRLFGPGPAVPWCVGHRHGTSNPPLGS
jgi:hypothetical protein